jgi:hypothetical protein
MLSNDNIKAWIKRNQPFECPCHDCVEYNTKIEQENAILEELLELRERKEEKHNNIEMKKIRQCIIDHRLDTPDSDSSESYDVECIVKELWKLRDENNAIVAKFALKVYECDQLRKSQKELMEANQRANLMIGDISDEYARYVNRENNEKR